MARPRPRGRRAAALAAALAGALALLGLGAATPALAQPADHVEYWSATLTVQAFTGGGRGCRQTLRSSNSEDCRNTATLTDDEFRHLDNRYEMYFIGLRSGGTSFRIQFTEENFATPSPALKSELTLRIGNNIALALRDGTSESVDFNDLQISWPTTTAITNAMQVGASVRLRLTGPDHAPELPSQALTGQVAENSGGGITVVGARKIRPSGGTPPYVFSLGGRHASLYAIDSETGAITTRAGADYDYESAPECHSGSVFLGPCHTLTVRVRIPVIPISRSSLIPITDSTLSDHQSERSDAGVPIMG